MRDDILVGDRPSDEQQIEKVLHKRILIDCQRTGTGFCIMAFSG